MKKTFCLLLVCLMVLPLLFACGREEDTTATEGDTTPVVTPVVNATELNLVKDGTSDYVIVTASEPSTTVQAAAKKLRDGIKTATGVTLSAVTDTGAVEDTAKEIVVGCVSNRYGVSDLQDAVREGEYRYRIVGNRLVIVAFDESLLATAIDSLFTKCPGTTGEMTFTKDSNTYKKCSFTIKEFKMYDNVLGGTQIVIPKDYTVEMFMAKTIQCYIQTNSGWHLDIVTDDAPEKAQEILVGKTARTTVVPGTGKYAVKMVGTKLNFVADNVYGLFDAYDQFRKIVPYNQQTVVLNETVSAEGDANYTPKDLAKSGAYRIMYHNVWGTLNGTENSWRGDRPELATETYKQYDPDILCLQEVHPQWRNTATAEFEYLNSKYTQIQYRHNGSSMAIFYKDELFECLENGTKWTSEGSLAVGSLGVMYAVLKDKSDKILVVINVHYSSGWNASTTAIGDSWREEDARNTVSVYNTLIEKYPNATVICGGDFNCNLSTNAYKTVKNAGFTAVNDMTTDNMTYACYHGTGSKNWYKNDYSVFAIQYKLNYAYKDGIDHMLFAGTLPTVHRYHVLSDPIALSCSDHAPHFVDVTLK